MTVRVSHSSIRVATALACVAFLAVALMAKPPSVASPSAPTTLHERYSASARVSSIIFPKQDIPLKFSHAKHLARNPLACTYCHDRAADSTSALDNLLPTETDCATCHAIDRSKHDKQVAAGRGPARCDTCHTAVDPVTGSVPRVKIPIPNIKFNHKAHVSRNISCETCHGDMKNVGLATRRQLPTMSLCLSCHNNKRSTAKKSKAPARCTTCHLATTGGFMQTKFSQGKLQPSGVLRGAAHDATFGVSHRAAAQNSGKFCESCHRKSFCVDCHNGQRKRMKIHGNDYLALHVVDAKRNNPNCSSCHRVQTFCVGCHSRSGVAADGRGSDFLGPSSGVLDRRYHPAGWIRADSRGILKGQRGLMHHSFQAQRNIKQCAACHREEFCTKCHSAQAGNIIKVNPHPRNWRNSRRCRSLLARAGRMCLRCHTNVREARCDYMAP